MGFSKPTTFRRQPSKYLTRIKKQDGNKESKSKERNQSLWHTYVKCWEGLDGLKLENCLSLIEYLMDSNLPSYFWFKLKQSINVIDRDRFDQFIDGCAQDINYKDYRGMNLLMFYLFYANPIDPYIIKVVASLVDI